MDAVTELQKSLKTLKDTSYDSIDSLMRKIMKKHDVTAKELHNGFKSEYGKTPDDYINEDLRDWFGKGGKGGHGGGGWDKYNSKGERDGKCARDKPSDPKPKCLSKDKANRLRSQGGAKAIASAVKRKRKADPVADRKGKGGKPIMVSNKLQNEEALGVDDAVTQPDIVKYTDTPEVQNSPGFSAQPRYCTKCKKIETQAECAYGPKAWVIYSVPPRLQTVFGEEAEAPEQKIVTESLTLEERVMLGAEAMVLEKNEPTNPGLWSKMVSKAKSKFDVYPSAYANGWAAKQYKAAGGSWKSKTKKESVTIEDANGNTFAEVVDVVSVEDMQRKEEIKASIAERRELEAQQKEEQIDEAVRLPSTNGNFYTVSLIWRMKMYVVKFFFPKVGMVSRADVNDEVQKIYHGAKLVSYELSTEQPGTPFIQVTKFNGGDRGGAVFDSQTAFTGPGIPEEVQVEEADSITEKKSEMACNKPKAQAVGDSKTGKSHVVKACSGGQEKLIRFGQKGVKGSPDGAKRNKAFKARHSKNIAKGKMSAAYWANKVKW